MQNTWNSLHTLTGITVPLPPKKFLDNPNLCLFKWKFITYKDFYHKNFLSSIKWMHETLIHKTVRKFLPSGHQFLGSTLHTCEMRLSWLGQWCRMLPPHRRHGECQCPRTTLSGGTWSQSLFLLRKNIYKQTNPKRTFNHKWWVKNCWLKLLTHPQPKFWKMLANQLNLEEETFF